MDDARAEEFKKRFRVTIRKLRKGTSQVQLAARLGTAQSNLSHYERLRQMPTLGVIEAVALEIGSPVGKYVAYLYGEEDGLEVSEMPIEAQIRLLPYIDQALLCKRILESLEAELRRLG
jgi:transcriptional regulator with XRE-family HTH domain